MLKVIFHNRRIAEPSFPRLCVAAAMAGVGFMAGALMLGHLPDGWPHGGFAIAAPVIGGVFGWRICGRTPGIGVAGRIGRATTAALCTGFWLVVALALEQAMMRGWNGFYRSLSGAFVDAVTQLIAVTRTVAQPDVGIVLFLGSILCVMLGDWTGRRWR